MGVPAEDMGCSSQPFPHAVFWTLIFVLSAHRVDDNSPVLFRGFLLVFLASWPMKLRGSTNLLREKQAQFFSPGSWPLKSVSFSVLRYCQKFCWSLRLLVVAPILCPDCLPASSALLLVPWVDKCPEGQTSCSVLAHILGFTLLQDFVLSSPGCLRSSLEVFKLFLGILSRFSSCSLRDPVYSKLLNIQKQELLCINLVHVFYFLCWRKDIILVRATFIKEDMFSSKEIEKNIMLIKNEPASINYVHITSVLLSSSINSQFKSKY